MSMWNRAILVAVVLVASGALYVRLRWRRSPQAYRAMTVLAGLYFIAGLLAGAWVLHVANKSNVRPAPVLSEPSISVSPVASAPSPVVLPSAMASFDLGSLHYDPLSAILPDPKLTPGDVFAGATAADVCTPGWSREHRQVTEAMRNRVYAEYGRMRGPGCCEVDHLIPLELGGSNDLKNLWPEPDDPRPGDAEKDQLENELHRLVCAGSMNLADAQRCIASNWVECWEKYMLPQYKPAIGAASP